MEENNFYYDTDLIDTYRTILTKGSVDYEECENSSKQKFSKLKARGLFNKGFTKLERAFDATSKTMENCKNVNEAYKEQIVTFEKTTSSKIETMKMPSNFSINDSMEINNVATVSLDKNDGRSVNEGVESTEKELTDRYNEVNRSSLGNINNEIAQVEQKLDNLNTIKEKETLKDMTGKEEQKEQIYDDRVDINNQALNGINTTQKSGVVNNSEIEYTLDKKEINSMEGEELK